MPLPRATSFALPLLLAVAGCLGDELDDGDLGTAESELAPGHVLLANGNAILTRRCLTASGHSGVRLTAAVCDGTSGTQGFEYRSATRQLASQMGPGVCLAATATGTIVFAPCSATAANQVWTVDPLASWMDNTADAQIKAPDGRCLSLFDGGVTQLRPCDGGAHQRWRRRAGTSPTFQERLRGGLVDNEHTRGLLAASVTFPASAETIADSGGAILTWTIHPIAYKPLQIGQENIGLVVVGRDTFNAIRAYASAQFVRNWAAPTTFVAEWRMFPATNTRGNLRVLAGVAQAPTRTYPSFDPQQNLDGTTLLAIVRRDLLAAPAATSTRLTDPQTKLIRARGAHLMAAGTYGGGTRLSSEELAWTRTVFEAFEPVVANLPRGNGYPNDPNAAPATCSRLARNHGGTSCPAQPTPVPTGRACQLHSFVAISGTSLSCTYDCCPLAL